MTTVATWTEASGHSWPTRSCQVDELGLCIALPGDWAEPEVFVGKAEQSGIARGPSACDWFDVSVLRTTDFDKPLTELLDRMLAAVALPTAQPKQWMDTANVLSWYRHDAAETEPLRCRLGCDEAHAYRGLAAVIVDGGKPQLCRIYTLLLRRGERVWKLSLGLSTECALGYPESMIIPADHVRAAAVFAGLRLL